MKYMLYFFSQKQACEFLGVSKQQLRALSKKEILLKPEYIVGFGNKLFFRKSRVKRYLLKMYRREYKNFNKILDQILDLHKKLENQDIKLVDLWCKYQFLEYPKCKI
mgnify:CR=1 FL=1